jgi:hypothetical protein
LATYISGKMVYDGGLGVMVTELFWKLKSNINLRWNENIFNSH